MSGRQALVVLAALLCASAALNAWLLSSREATAQAEGAGVATSPTAARPEAGSAEAAAASFTTLVKSVEATRRASAIAAGADRRAGDQAPPVEGAADGRVTRALLDDVQCRIAREKATDAWRKEADRLRAALLRGDTPSPAIHDVMVRDTRAQLADMLGVDDGDGRLSPLAEDLQRYEEQAHTEVRRLVALEPPDWRAALDAVLGMYRQEDAAVQRAFGATAADDWRLQEVDSRAGVLAIGASLVGVPWSSIDDRTPPSAP